MTTNTEEKFAKLVQLLNDTEVEAMQRMGTNIDYYQAVVSTVSKIKNFLDSMR